jgi:hypothetical protein
MDNHDEYLKELCDLTTSHSQIPQELYHRFNVKRGLRNTDGTGVLVGLTNIGEVHGYTIDESEKVPDTGKLYYRGYSVEDLIQGYSNPVVASVSRKPPTCCCSGNSPPQPNSKISVNSWESTASCPPISPSI